MFFVSQPGASVRSLFSDFYKYFYVPFSVFLLIVSNQASAVSLRHFSIANDGSLQAVMFDSRNDSSTITMRHGGQREEWKFCDLSVSAYFKVSELNAFIIAQNAPNSDIRSALKIQIIEQSELGFGHVAGLRNGINSAWLDGSNQQIIIQTNGHSPSNIEPNKRPYFASFDLKSRKIEQHYVISSVLRKNFADGGALRISADEILFNSSRQKIGDAFHSSALRPFFYSLNTKTGRVQPSNWLSDSNDQHEIAEYSADMAAEYLVPEGLYFALWSDKSGWGRKVKETTSLMFQPRGAKSSAVVGEFRGVWRNFVISPNGRYVAAEIYRYFRPGIVVPLEDSAATIAIFDLHNPAIPTQTADGIAPQQITYHSPATRGTSCVKIMEATKLGR